MQEIDGKYSIKRKKLMKTTTLITLLVAATMILSGAVTGITMNLNENTIVDEAENTETVITYGIGDDIGVSLEPEISSPQLAESHLVKTNPRTAIVWDNGMDYLGMGSSQDDTAYPLFTELADDFEFPTTQVVGDVHWVGGYWSTNYQTGEFDWRITFYEDGGGGIPGSIYAGPYEFAWADINTVELEDTGTSLYYQMDVDIPLTAFSGGQKYWIGIQGIGFFPPQSGFGYHSGFIGEPYAFRGEIFTGTPDWLPNYGPNRDTCFQLTADPSEHDVGVTEIKHPTHLDMPGCPCIPVEVEVTNMGLHDEVDIPVNVEIHRNLWTQTFGYEPPDEMPFYIDGGDCSWQYVPVETSFPNAITPFDGAFFAELNQFGCLGTSYLTTEIATDLTEQCIDPVLKFYFWHDQYGSDDYMTVEANDGSGWTEIGGPYFRLCCPDCPEGWQEYRISLADYIGQSAVMFRFVGHCEMPLDSYNLGLDYVCVFDLEYEESQIIDIDVGETLQVEFPCWSIECFWCQYENDDIIFHVGAWTDMEFDGNPFNDGWGPLQTDYKIVTIHIPFTHDVGDKEITEPADDYYMAGQSLEMIQTIKNYGKEPEGCFNVYMSIEEQYIVSGGPGLEILNEDFETWPPAGWTVTQFPMYYDTWNVHTYPPYAYYGRPNYAGTGQAACIDSDSWGGWSGTYSGGLGGELITPSFSLMGIPNAKLEFNAVYNYLCCGEYFQVDVSISGPGGPWNTEIFWIEDHNAYGPAEHVEIDLAAYADQSNVCVRFVFEDMFIWAYYIQIDDVLISTPDEPYVYDYHDPFYIEQVCVDDIGVCQDLPLSFPDWTPEPPEPCFCGTQVYRISSWTKMLDPQDQNALNDKKTKLVTVEFLHDVAITEFTDPASAIGGAVIFEQLPHQPADPWSIGTSDLTLGYKMYENFWALAGEIGDIHWWGLCLYWTGSGWSAGNPDNMVFDVGFYEDDAGLPGAEVDYFADVDCTYVGTGLFYAGFEMQAWSVDELPDCVDLVAGFVSIQGTQTTGDAFLWHSALTGDGFSYQEGAVPPETTYDRAFQLTECENGNGGPELPDPDIYLPCGEQEFCVMIENLGTYDEDVDVVWTFYEYTPDKEIVDSGSVAISLGIGDEEEVCLFTYLFEEDGVYEVEVEVVSPTDCNLDNNGPINLIIGIDCCAPESCFVIDPETPDGENNWYVSMVTVTVDAWENCDLPSGVAEIVYIIDGVMDTIPGDHGTFVIDGDGVHFIEIYAVDNVGNEEEEHRSFEVAIDQTEPTIDLIHETYQDDADNWMIDFTATANDVTSGMNRVEFKIDGVLDLTLYAAPYDWTVVWEDGMDSKTFSATAYDDAGNSATEEIDNIKSLTRTQSQTQTVVKVVQRVVTLNLGR